MNIYARRTQTYSVCRGSQPRHFCLPVHSLLLIKKYYLSSYFKETGVGLNR
jgi:hypothetical protein